MATISAKAMEKLHLKQNPLPMKPLEKYQEISKEINYNAYNQPLDESNNAHPSFAQIPRFYFKVIIYNL